jgi:hypothetical protein
MPKPEGVTSMFWSFAGVACSKPCASRGEKLTSRLELSRITIRPLRRSYRADSARGVDPRNAFARRFANSNRSLDSMHFLPCLAKHAHQCRQAGFDRCDVAPGAPRVGFTRGRFEFASLRRKGRTDIHLQFNRARRYATHFIISFFRFFAQSSRYRSISFW